MRKEKLRCLVFLKVNYLTLTIFLTLLKWHNLSHFYDIPVFTSIPFPRGSKVGDEWLWSGFTTHSKAAPLNLLNQWIQWYMASFIEDFPIQRQARAKCNREVGSQIENLRVVIVITDWRFILLDSFNRSGVFASTLTLWVYIIYIWFCSTYNIAGQKI